MSRRRTPLKPILPGFGWLLVFLLLLGLLFGSYGLLSHWTIYERVSPLNTKTP